jgi:triosephosphate isomerase
MIQSLKGVSEMANASRGLFIAGNWKMFKTNTEARQFVLELAQTMPTHPGVQAWVAPSYTLLATTISNIQQAGITLQVAAQNVESALEGAFTGEVSAKQLNDINVAGVIIGHSERRTYYNETNASVNAKTKTALAQGLLPIVCVGETLSEREAGQTDAVVTAQTLEGLAGLTAPQVASVVIAYEPVWAIGTGKVCETPEANRVCGVIRQVLAEQFGQTTAQAVRILYGGSMKPDNAEGLLASSDIDGGLIGGASLQADSFAQLLTIAKTTLEQLQTLHV